MITIYRWLIYRCTRYLEGKRFIVQVYHKNEYASFVCIYINYFEMSNLVASQTSPSIWHIRGNVCGKILRLDLFVIKCCKKILYKKAYQLNDANQKIIITCHVENPTPSCLPVFFWRGPASYGILLQCPDAAWTYKHDTTPRTTTRHHLTMATRVVEIYDVPRCMARLFVAMSCR